MDDADREVQRLRLESRGDREDAEASAAALAAATRSFRDAILDHARSGAELRVDVAGASMSGRVVHVGEDLVRLVTADLPSIDISIGAIDGVFVREAPIRPTAVSTGYPATMLARCRELVQVNADVRMGRRSSSVIVGTLTAVSATHVEVAPQAEGNWLLPLGDLAWVARAAN